MTSWQIMIKLVVQAATLIGVVDVVVEAVSEVIEAVIKVVLWLQHGWFWIKLTNFQSCYLGS